MSKVFFGNVTHAIDRQRRVAIPSDWRGKKDTVFYVIPGTNEEISVLSEKEFNKMILGPAEGVEFTDADSADALSDLGSMGQVCKCDSQGRICLSSDLLEYAGLEVSGMALLKGSVTSIRICKVPSEEAPVKERAAKFLKRLAEITQAQKDAANGSRG